MLLSYIWPSSLHMSMATVIPTMQTGFEHKIKHSVGDFSDLQLEAGPHAYISDSPTGLMAANGHLQKAQGSSLTVQNPPCIRIV